MSDRTIRLRLPAKETPLLGGATVWRALPRRECRALGPFVFLDHAGPTPHAPGERLYIPPHPHAGLSTVSWLFDGALLHKDSLGTTQALFPGDLNWMTSGRGIVHSEESEAGFLHTGGDLHLVQIWVALPAAARTVPPSFAHHPAASLPRVQQPGAEITVVAGEWQGARSPVHTHSPLLYLVVELAAGARVPLPWPEGWDAGLFATDGALTAAGEPVAYRELVCFSHTGDIVLGADTATRCILIGGAPLTDTRAIWGNFVLGTVEECKRAQADFEAGRFGRVG